MLLAFQLACEISVHKHPQHKMKHFPENFPKECSLSHFSNFPLNFHQHQRKASRLLPCAGVRAFEARRQNKKIIHYTASQHFSHVQAVHGTISDVLSSSSDPGKIAQKRISLNTKSRETFSGLLIWFQNCFRAKKFFFDGNCRKTVENCGELWEDCWKLLKCEKVYVVCEK